MDKIDVLTELLATYTSQMEQYERLSTDFSITCVGFIGVLIGVLITALSIAFRTDANNRGRKIIYRLVSVVLMIIPCFSILFFYVFSMNCRKVAIYQGYMTYLEGVINDNICGDYIIHNSKLVDNFLAEGFPTNRFGGIVMIIVFILVIGASVAFSIYFYKLANEINNTGAGGNVKTGKLFKILYIIAFVLICVMVLVFGSILMCDLLHNDDVRHNVTEFCINNLNSSCIN